MLKPALITTIIGIILLMLLSFNLEPGIKKISEISDSDLGNFVKVYGKIENVKQTDTLTIIKVADGNISINVIADNAQFEVNSSVEVIGKVTEYKGTLEIEASRIKTI
jgi:RecJ-like exonuclease